MTSTLAGKTKFDNHNDGYNIRVRTPSGIIFLAFVDDVEGNLVRIIPFTGKAGSEVSNWADATCTLINFGLENKTLDPLRIIGLLDGIYSHGLSRQTIKGDWIYSGVNGIVYALREYLKIKNPSKSYRAKIMGGSR